MPKTLTPVSVFPSSIPNFPLAGAGEPVAIGPLESAVQAVLNRTEHLHTSRQVVETTGVRRIQRVVSLTALQNLAGMADGDTVDVEGYGRYRLYNPSGLTADGLWVLNAAGGGRWVHTLRDMRGAGNGLATLDSSQRLAQDVRDASILTQHIANQAVTSAKLAPGSVVGHLGYTPLNKAGDTMMGELSLPNVVTTVGTNGFGIRHIELRTSSLRWGMGLGANESGSNSGANFFLWRYDDAGNFLGEAFRAERNSGRVVFNEISGRYDHQNRFVVSAFAGQGIAVSGNSFTVLGGIFVTVPSGRSLYVRRVRAHFTGDFRARVAAITGSVWVAGQAALDADINQNVLAGPASQLVYVGADNVSGSSQTVQQGHGAMIELEIR
jgi:hypothetical protein